MLFDDVGAATAGRWGRDGHQRGEATGGFAEAVRAGGGVAHAAGFGGGGGGRDERPIREAAAQGEGGEPDAGAAEPGVRGDERGVSEVQLRVPAVSERTPRAAHALTENRSCYHSKSANKVPVDGAHTAVEVARQMALLRAQRGGVAHAQLIGGEVTLLGARAHATALEVMAHYGRIPMSFTHGDFDYDYLVTLATHADGRRRFARLDFAAHFDKYMRGRRGLPAPTSEAQLNEYRRRFLGMFERLRREHGVRSYCAHNLTVQRGNVGEVAQVVGDILGFKGDTNFRMLSFQPASETGARRVVGESVNGDDVWREIERGAGVRLPYRLFTMGHPSCNRVCFCARFGAVVVPFFDDTSAEDAALRDQIISDFGNIVLPQWQLFLKIARVAVSRPRLLGGMVRWVGRFMRRCSNRGVVLSREISRLRLITFVMHSFMDASQVSCRLSAVERVLT